MRRSNKTHTQNSPDHVPSPAEQRFSLVNFGGAPGFHSALQRCAERWAYAARRRFQNCTRGAASICAPRYASDEVLVVVHQLGASVSGNTKCACNTGQTRSKRTESPRQSGGPKRRAALLCDLLDAPTALAACCGFDLCHKYILYLYLYLLKFLQQLSAELASRNSAYTAVVTTLPS